jgi:hypothetical protein
MKNFLAIAALMLCCVGCSDMREIDFVYFNLSPNEIFVESVAGLPLRASPGVLIPVHAEDQLSAKGAIFFGETADIPSTLKIIWKEGGSSHQAELKRDELGIPAKFKNGKIRFTYLGGDKWRVKVVLPK